MADFIIDCRNFEKEIRRSFGKNFGQKMDKETVKAINKGINLTISDVVKAASQISKEAYTARAGKYKAKRKTARQMVGEVKFSGRRGHGLFHFKPQPRRITHPRPVGGVTTQIKRGGSRYAQQIPGFTPPFIARKRQGGYALFARRKGGSRKDLLYLLGPSTIQAIIRKDSRKELEAVGQEEFLENVLRTMNDMLAEGR